MEIGGYDTEFQNHSLIEEIKNFCNWPNAVIEPDELDGKSFFYYEDQACKDVWDEDIGPENTMIHFIIEEKGFTIVTDEELTMKIKSQFQ